MAVTSHSQSQTYIQCPQHWKNRYKEGLTSKTDGAALAFGSAMDKAVELILTKKPRAEYEPAFEKLFYSTVDRSQNYVPIFDSKIIEYYASDFDEYVLTEEDRDSLDVWQKDLKLTKWASTGVNAFKEIAKVEKNPHRELHQDAKTFYNRACWLSLKRKGLMLLNAFEEQFMPKVTKVHDIQKYIHLKDDSTGDKIIGYIDFVAEIEGYDKPIIFDLKTSSRAYNQSKIEQSDQLTLYIAMEGNSYETDLVGYVVLVKNIKRVETATCNKCGHTKVSSHKTCNNEVNGKRCGGTWDESFTLAPEVQVMVQSKSEEQVRIALEDQANIVEAMKRNIIYRNTAKCSDWYGGKCPYYDVCWNNDYSKVNRK